MPVRGSTSRKRSLLAAVACVGALAAAVLLAGVPVAAADTAPAAAASSERRTIAHDCAYARSVARDAAGKRRFHSATRCLINALRHTYRLPEVTWSSRLYSSARRHSYDMRRRGYFGHVSPDGVRLTHRVRPTGYLRGPGRWWLGETLARGTGRAITPQAVIQALLDSPAHRAVLLNRVYDEVGIGIALGTRPSRSRPATITLHFGRR
jgi:uncharacterized protein YkwD